MNDAPGLGRGAPIQRGSTPREFLTTLVTAFAPARAQGYVPSLDGIRGAVGLPLTFAVAILSYRYLEQPCLQLRTRALRPWSTCVLGSLVPASVVAGSIWIAYGLVDQ